MIAFTASAAPLGRTRLTLRAHTLRACASSGNVAQTSKRLSRRATLAALATAAVSVSAIFLPDASHEAIAAEAALEPVVSDKYGYSFGAPSNGWTKNKTTLSGFRELTLIVKDGTDGNTNISMVETPVQGDFKKLTSFGPMDSVLKTLVPNGQGGVTGEIISAALDASKNAYVVEYKLKPSQDAAQRHLLTVFSLQPGRFLLTLTGQTTEEEWDSEAALMRRVADSYRIKLMD